MAFSIITEALARIEHKIDILLRSEGRRTRDAVVSPMSFLNICPVCLKIVEYQIDLNANVVKRCCGCSTGISPSVVPMYPTQPKGTQDASGRPSVPAANHAEDGD